MEYNTFELFSAQGGSEYLWVWKTFAEAELALGERVLLKPGAVLHLSKPTQGLEPRLRASWRPWGSQDQEFSATIGLYRQALSGLSDTRDAASVFVAWTRVPDGASTEALHALLGWQQSLGPGFNWSLEGYYQRYRNISVPVWTRSSSSTRTSPWRGVRRSEPTCGSSTIAASSTASPDTGGAGPSTRRRRSTSACGSGSPFSGSIRPTTAGIR
jgi:hypothetical protein